MKAIVVKTHGGLDHLEWCDHPDPEPGPGEALLRVKACALNHLDLWVRQGLPGVPIQLPHVPGCDVAGVVEKVGAGVSVPEVGAQVVVAPGVGCGHCLACDRGDDNLCREYQILGGYKLDGGYAEMVRVPADHCLPKPSGLSWEEAASIPLVFLTAWHMLVTLGQVRPGSFVLVQAGGSGVGIAAIQIARLFGAHVMTTVGSDEKVPHARSLGAEEVVQYTKQDFVEEAKRWTGGRGVDLVVEHIGPAVFAQSLKSLAKGGRLVTCGATSGPKTEIELRHLFARKLQILGSFMGRRSELRDLLPFFDQGLLRPVVDSVYPLERAREAQERMEARRNFGKIVLKVSSAP